MTDKRNIWEDDYDEAFLAGVIVGVIAMIGVELVIFAWMVW